MSEMGLSKESRLALQLTSMKPRFRTLFPSLPTHRLLSSELSHRAAVNNSDPFVRFIFLTTRQHVCFPWVKSARALQKDEIVHCVRIRRALKLQPKACKATKVKKNRKSDTVQTGHLLISAITVSKGATWAARLRPKPTHALGLCVLSYELDHISLVSLAQLLRAFDSPHTFPSTKKKTTPRSKHWNLRCLLANPSVRSQTMKPQNIVWSLSLVAKYSTAIPRLSLIPR